SSAPRFALLLVRGLGVGGQVRFERPLPAFPVEQQVQHGHRRRGQHQGDQRLPGGPEGVPGGAQQQQLQQQRRGAGPVLAVEQADPGGQHTGGQQPVVAGFAEGAGAVEGADPAEVAGGSADQQRGDEQQPRDGLERGDEPCDAQTARGGGGRNGGNAYPT